MKEIQEWKKFFACTEDTQDLSYNSFTKYRAGLVRVKKIHTQTQPIALQNFKDTEKILKDLGQKSLSSQN